MCGSVCCVCRCVLVWGCTCKGEGAECMGMYVGVCGCGRFMDASLPLWDVGVWDCRCVGVQIQNEWRSFSSNSDCGMELNLHIPFHSFLHTLTGKPLLPGPRPRPHPDHLCGTVLHLRGTTGAEDQV